MLKCEKFTKPAFCHQYLNIEIKNAVIKETMYTFGKCVLH